MSKSKYKDKFFEFTSALNEKMEMLKIDTNSDSVF